MQYFERVRLEWHPETPPPYDVLLGQFGRLLHPADPPAAAIPGMSFFAATGHNVPPDFAAYWQANGGLGQFGYPLSEILVQQLEDGKRYQVQYFERARFEWHPENASPYTVELGQFGRRILASIPPGQFQPVTTAPSPVPPSTAADIRAQGAGFAITVHQVYDPAAAGRLFGPASGKRYAAIDVSLENQLPEWLAFNEYDAEITVSGGRSYFPTITEIQPAYYMGDLQPGGTIRGWLNFEIPSDAQVVSFSYAPVGFKSVTIDLSGRRLATTTPKRPYEDVPGVPSQNTGYRVIIHQVLDPAPAGRLFGPAAGMRYVAVDLSLENLQTVWLYFNPYEANLITKDGTAYLPWVTEMEPRFLDGYLQPNGIMRGWINFEIPANAEVTEFIYAPLLDNQVAFDIAQRPPAAIPQQPGPAPGDIGPGGAGGGCGSRGGPGGPRTPGGKCPAWPRP